MQLFKSTLTFNFNKYTSITGIVSVLLILISLFLVIINGLNLAVEFTGGTNLNLTLEKTSISEFRENINNILSQKVEVVEIENNDSNSNFLLRTKFLEDESIMIDKLKLIYPSLELNSIDSFGPKLGAELQSSARNAILLALLLISLYIAIRFDRYYALGSLAALVHDVLIVLGFFSILNMEFDLTVLAALLAVIGYSLNDTIVVSDRIRENFRKLRRINPEEVINISLTETLGRTLVTSLTTMLVLISLAVLGGEMIHGFSIALLVGVITGTYSSIYVAANTLLVLGVTEEDLMIPVKEGADQDELIP